MTHPTTSSNLRNSDALLPVVGEATAEIIAMLRVFVDQCETLLISGPTGSGKSRLARWCHQQSPRRDQVFETLDLLSVPAELQLAELVGWKRGAFTGATQNVGGALTRAAKGTLFIDEIDKLSLEAQAGLLRILEERRYRALGDGADEKQADVHFIIGTNADLRSCVRAGRFREDLYYRINVLPVRLPPLAERLDEVPGWAAFMLARCSGEDQVGLGPAAVKLLSSYPWPGNLRQLDNVIRRAYAFALAEGHGRLELVVEARHVERAMTFEGGSEPGSDVSAGLWHVAEALAHELVRRGQSGESAIPLELLDGFRGMVLGATVELLGSREEAFRLFAREHLLNGRNHHRALKREFARTRRLIAALGGELTDPELRTRVGSPDLRSSARSSDQSATRS